MSANRTAFYDPDTKTLWVARAFLGDTKQMSKDEVFALVALRQAGTTDDGHPIEAIHVLFRNEEAAARHYQTLAFVDIGVFYQQGGNRLPYLPEDGPLEVDVRADFGIVIPED